VIAGFGMYRVISASLVTLMLIAVVFAAIGVIGYTPGGIALTAFIAVAVTMLTSLMGAQTAKTIAHLESSVITGLLIAFIVPPTLETRDLLGVTAAAAIAGLSKYLLVFRGRHVLNPAATGVTIASFLGLTAGFWWVANPPLTPFIVLAGLVIAWRSGLLLIALIGLGVGVSAVLIRLVASGEDVWLSVYLVATSYPIVFLALFMLTEPLTMAQRRQAQVLVAIVVGLGSALPFSVPLGSLTFYSSPELALLVGNLVAFVAMLIHRAARSAELSLLSSSDFGQSGFLLRFASTRPLPLRAGQWVELHFPHRNSDTRGQRRVFSVVSPPHQAQGDAPVIEIATTLAERGSSFKHALSGAPSTSPARVSNIGGDFLLPTDPTKPILMIAGGIGITPFISQLAALTHRGETRDIVLLEVRSAEAEHPFEAVIKSSGVLHKVVSRDQIDSTLDALDPEPRSRVCMVSGSPGFVKTLRAELRKRGVPRIHTDSFVGY
jgi:glycine betaine catabolism B